MTENTTTPANLRVMKKKILGKFAWLMVRDSYIEVPQLVKETSSASR